jgi:hypothetical protein
MARIAPSRRSIAPTRDFGPGFRSAQKAIFCNESAYWSIGYSGNTVRLKDRRGLGYVAHLLRHPGAGFHTLDLYGGIASGREEDRTGRSVPDFSLADQDLEKGGVQIGRPGDAGEMLDEQVKIAYRRRLSELHEELEEAKELGTVERAEKAEEEIDALTRELSRAV